MSYDQPSDETIRYHGMFIRSTHADPFAICVTDQAVHIPRKKLFAVRDPYYFERWPKDEVSGWRIDHVMPWPAYCLGGSLLMTGALVTWTMFEQFSASGGGTLAVAPLFLIGVGASILLTARTRRRFSISTMGKRYRWTYPPSLSRDQKRQLGDVFAGIEKALRGAGFAGGDRDG